MKSKLIVLGIILLAIISCKDEPTGPESDCHLLPIYKLDYHFLNAAKVFDIRTNPPKEIKNGTIEYDLTYQWFFLNDDIPTPYPYSEYFIDTIEFENENSVDVKIFESNFMRTYEFTRNDCQLELESPEGNLSPELTNSGDEISEQRFAIYDHKSKRVTIDTLSFLSDTFLFIEFRLGPFLTYEDIIKQFALDNPGKYDTIAIELVQNRTKE